MKFQKITRSIMLLLAKLHFAALRADCACAGSAADRAYSRAAEQLNMIKQAKANLAEMQSEALKLGSDSRHAQAAARDEIAAIKIGLGV